MRRYTSTVVTAGLAAVLGILSVPHPALDRLWWCERWGGELCPPVHHNRPGSGNQRFPATRV